MSRVLDIFFSSFHVSRCSTNALLLVKSFLHFAPTFMLVPLLWCLPYLLCMQHICVPVSTNQETINLRKGIIIMVSPIMEQLA